MGMTENEAIEWLSPKTSPLKIHVVEMQGERPLAYINEAIDVAIKSMEKQIPKKPIYQDENEKCPSCGSFVILEYCAKCGQKIDWGNEDAD